jgi:putative ABC transport system permease protein
MIRQLIKIILKNKTRNSLLMLEMLVSFLVCFVLFTLLYNYVLRYNQPLGYNYNNVLVMSMTNKRGDERATLEQIKQRLIKFKEVVTVSNCDSHVPYAVGWATSGIKSPITQKHLQCHGFNVDDDFIETMGLKLVEGRWLNQSDEGQQLTSMIIDRETRNTLFQDKPAIGETLNGLYKVVGVIEPYRVKGELGETVPTFFTRISNKGARNTLLIKLNQETSIHLEEKIWESTTALARDWTIEISSLEHMRTNSFMRHLIPMGLLAFVGLFMILNVMLGLLGILWYNINHRNNEIGLRRAIGSTIRTVQNQFVFEMGLLGTLAMLPAIALAINVSIVQPFEVTSRVYTLALTTALLFIYLLITLCAYIPGRQAAKVQPAVALAEE